MSKLINCKECGTLDKNRGFGLCGKCYRKTSNYLNSIKKYRSTTKWRLVKKEYDKRIRLEALTHYSKGTPKCACCGETHLEFLAFDHINGGGNAHIRSINRYKLGQWLRKHNYPEGYQILCHNCNMAKGIYGKCPHTQTAQAVVAIEL